MADCTYFLDTLIGTFLNSWQHFLVGYESEYVVPSDRNFDCDIKLMCYLKKSDHTRDKHNSEIG